MVKIRKEEPCTGSRRKKQKRGKKEEERGSCKGETSLKGKDNNRDQTVGSGKQTNWGKRQTGEGRWN